jgi:hypothetical protein
LFFPKIIRVIKSKKMEREINVADMVQMGKIMQNSCWKTGRKKRFGKLRRGWEENKC